MKYTFSILTILLLVYSCEKPTQNEIVAEQFLGGWETSSFIVNDVEQNTNSNTETLTFFDIEKAGGYVHLKQFNQSEVIKEIEGTFLVEIDGSKIGIFFLEDKYNYTIEKISEDTYLLGTARLKNGILENIKYRANKVD